MSQAFTQQIRVRWGEVDAQGVVFNAHYLVYADVAGTEYYRHLGVLHADIPDLIQVYVVDAHLSFKSPARNDDLLTCTVTPTHIGNSSFQLRVSIARDTTLLTEITLTYVRAINGQPTRLSEPFRALIS
ncbi:acyl-CoA thioesterase [Brevundimonas sp.]|uniref:acyl-CoA thioesterase n=1 Tax=Brevundimonas sp. TaxID=1871086 RepID=UPI002FCC64DD